MLLPILSQAAAAIQEPAIKLGEGCSAPIFYVILARICGWAASICRKRSWRNTTFARGFSSWQSKPAVYRDVGTRGATGRDASSRIFVMMPQIDEDCREALLAAALIYREILTVIRKNNYQVFAEKQRYRNNGKSNFCLPRKMLRQERWEG